MNTGASVHMPDGAMVVVHTDGRLRRDNCNEQHCVPLKPRISFDPPPFVSDGAGSRPPNALPIIYNIPRLQALLARLSISCTSRTPFTSSSPIASTTASPTKSTWEGFVPPAPINQLSLFPVMEFTVEATVVSAAIGIARDREES